MSTYYNPFQPDLGRSARGGQGDDITSRAITDSLRTEAAEQRRMEQEQVRAQRQAERDSARAARVDPVKNAISALSTKRADLRYMRTDLRNKLDDFIKTEGANIFEPDDPEITLDGQAPQKFKRDPNSKQFVLKWGPDGSASQEMIRLRQRAFSDPAAREELAQKEQHFNKVTRLALEKYQRYQAELARIDAAEKETEAQLGQFAAARQGWEPLSPFQAQVQVPQPSAPDFSADAAPAQPALDAAAPAASASSEGVTPAGLVRLRKQMQDAAASGDAETAKRLAAEIATGYGTLDPERQARVEKMEPGFWRRVGDLGLSLAKGGQNVLEGLDTLVSDFTPLGAGYRKITGNDLRPFQAVADAAGATAAAVVNAAEGRANIIDDITSVAPGSQRSTVISDAQSDDLKARREASAKVVAKAGEGKEGVEKIASQALTAMAEGISDPVQFTNTIAEQVAMLLPIGSAARMAKTARGAKLAGAGAGALLQGADVADNTKEEIGQVLANMSPEEASAVPGIAVYLKDGKTIEEAKAQFLVDQARKAFAIAAPTSFALNTIPGSVEDLIAKAATNQATAVGKGGLVGAAKGAAKGIATEVPQEMAEEGTGNFATNLAVRDVDPNRSLTEGLGETLGQAAVAAVGLGGGVGALTGSRPAPAAPGAGPASNPSVPPPAAPPVAPATPNVAPAPEAPDVTANPENGAPAEAFVFVDANTGRTIHVPASGLKEATSKLPAGFVPDQSKTRIVSAGQAPGQSVPAAPAPAPAPSAPAEIAEAPAPDNSQANVVEQPEPAVAEPPSNVVAQPVEQQSPKLPVAGSTPAGVASSDVDAPIPDWARQNIDAMVQEADRAGISDRIEELSAQRKTAKEVAAEAGTTAEVVRAVRAARNIPSMDDATAFNQWLAQRSQSSTPAPSAIQPVNAETPSAPAGEVVQAPITQEAPVTPEAGQATATQEADAGAQPPAPVSLADLPSEELERRSRLSNVLERTASKASKPAQLGKILDKLEEAPLPNGQRVAIAVAFSPAADADTFERAVKIAEAGEPRLPAGYFDQVRARRAPTPSQPPVATSDQPQETPAQTPAPAPEAGQTSQPARAAAMSLEEFDAESSRDVDFPLQAIDAVSERDFVEADAIAQLALRALRQKANPGESARDALSRIQQRASLGGGAGLAPWRKAIHAALKKSAKSPLVPPRSESPVSKPAHNTEHFTAIYNGREVVMDDTPGAKAAKFRAAAMRVRDNLGTGGVGYVVQPDGKAYRIDTKTKTAKPVPIAEVPLGQGEQTSQTKIKAERKAPAEDTPLIRFAKSKLPPSAAAQIKTEAQVESFRAQFEKEQAASTTSPSAPSPSLPAPGGVTAPVAAAEPAPAFQPTAAGLIALRRRITAGEATVEEIKAAWETLKANKPTLQKDLASMTKEQLLRFSMNGRASDSKANLVKLAASSLQWTFVAGDSLSYGLTAGMTQEKAIDEQMAKWTPEVIAQKKAERDARMAEAEKAKAAKEKALTNPETLEEFQRFAYAEGAKQINAMGPQAVKKVRQMPREAMIDYLRSRGLDAFTPEQRATYDALLAESTRAQREADAARTKTVEAVALPTGAQFSEVIETKHTQKGHDLFVVQLNQRVEREAYDALNTRAKRLGGSYSSYNKGGAIPGFQFRTREQAEQFRSGERVDGAERIEAKQESRRPEVAAKLRELGQKQIDAGNEKLNAERRTNTARQARMAASAEADASAQIRIGETMQNLADAIAANEVTFIDRITTKAHVEELERLLRQGQRERVQKQADAENWNYGKREDARQAPLSEEDAGFARFPMPYFQLSSLMQLVAKGRETEGAKLAAQRVQREVVQQMPTDRGGAYAQTMSQVEAVRELAEKLRPTEGNKWGPANTTLGAMDSMDRLARMDIKTEAELRSALREFAKYRGRTKQADPVKVMERELIGKQIPGFFPTPATLGRELVDRADIQPGMAVLEPSAGKGDLADVVKEAQPDAKLTVIEQNRTLTPILEAKGYAPEATDFLEHKPGEVYDRVVMNPPFENGQDIDHVRHAYSLLKPGGKLVAIMSEGPFYRQDKKASAFRDWLESVGGVSEKNPEGSFTGVEAFRQTGTATRMVEVTKPAASAPAAVAPAAEAQAEPVDIAALRKENRARLLPLTGEPLRQVYNAFGLEGRSISKARLEESVDEQKLKEALDKVGAKPEVRSESPPAKPLPFSAARKALLAQVDEAIGKAPSEADFMAQATADFDAREKEVIDAREAEIEKAKAANKPKQSWPSPIFPARGNDRTERIAYIARGIALDTLPADKKRVTFRAGTSTYRIENTKGSLDQFRKLVAGPIRSSVLARESTVLPSLTGEEMGMVRNAKETGRIEDPFIRGLMDRTTEAQFKSLGLGETHTRVSPGVVLTKEAAKALADLKAGKQTEFDVQASSGAAESVDSNLDPTYPSVLQFSDAPRGEYSETHLQHLGEFERQWNDERAKEGLDPVRFQPVALASGDPGAPAGVRDVQRGVSVFRKGLEQALKKRIVFVRVEGDSGFNGLSATAMANTILVDANAQAPFAAIVGHEVGHNIAAQNRVLWIKMRDIILQIAGNPPAEYEAKKRAQKYDTNEKILNEWVSDFLGQRFDEPEFWQEVERIADKRGEAQALKTFARSAFEWITDLGRKLRRVLTKFADRKHVERMEEVRRGLAQVLTDYVAQMPEAGYADNPDAAPGQKPATLEASQGPAETVDDGPETALSQSPRTERAGGNVVEDQEYEVRGHDLLVDEAKAHEKAVGETQALADALNPDNRRLRADTKEVIRFRALKRIQAKLADPTTSESEAIALSREAQRISFLGNDQTRERAQAQSARQLYTRDVGVDNITQLLDENQKRQERAIGEDGKKVVDDALDEIAKASKEAIDRMLANKADDLNQQDIGLPVWEKYRADAAQRMLDLLDSRTSLPEPKAALADFTDRVIAEMRRRIEPLLPEKPTSEQRPPSPMDVLKEAIENREKYADVFETVREQFVKEFGEGSAPVEMIDIELGNMGVRPYSAETLQKAIDEAISAMNTKIADLAREHVTKTDKVAADLAKALVDEAGLKPADAKRLAADLEKTARDAIQEARKEAIARLQAKHEKGTTRAKKVGGAIAKITELNNLGVLTRGDLMDLVAKELKLPRVSPEQIRKVARIADAVENAPDGLTKARLQYDLINEIRVIRGIGAADVGLSVWMANLLSGPMTHVANATSNALLSTINLASVMATNPRYAKQALEGWLSGFEIGWAEARDILRSGRSIREMGDVADTESNANAKTGFAGNVLEAVDYSRDFPKLPRALATGLQKHAAVMRYVSRAMRAADAVFYYPAREGYSRVATAKLLEGQYQGKELFAKVRESLGIAPDQFVRYSEQADREGWKGLDKTLRVVQLIEEQRKSTVAGVAAENEAAQFGREATINQDPEGIAGAVYRRLRDLNQDLPAMRVFLPFLRVPTNLFNESMNYSPLGFVRGLRGMRDSTGTGMRMFNETERAILYFKAWAGSLSMMGLTAMALGLRGDDDEEPWFGITATGPSDYRKRQQLEAAGWREFSVKIGDVWISYKDSPLILPFAAVGRVVDSVRYQTAKDAAEDRNPYLDALMLYPSVLFQTSMLTGLSTLMDAATASNANAAAIRFEQFLSNTAANVVVPNAARQVDRIIDPTVYQPDGVLGRIGGAVPFARQTGTVRTDVLGEPVVRSPLKRFVSVETNDPLREALRDKNVFIPTPSRETKIGNRTMTEEEYRVFFRLYGEGMNRTLSNWTDRIPSMDAERVEKLVRQVADRERERAKRQVIAGVN